ncbi:DUF3426 domain-containing protein [Bordetella sp. 2513F-2]
MALVTRCPQCGTAFKVVPDQLRVRNGLVRCGACSTVFDGRACLVQPAVPAPQPAPVPRAAGPRAPELPVSSAMPPARTQPPAVLRGRAEIRPTASWPHSPGAYVDDDHDDDGPPPEDLPYGAGREPDMPRPRPRRAELDLSPAYGLSAGSRPGGRSEPRLRAVRVGGPEPDESEEGAGGHDEALQEPPMPVYGEARTRLAGDTDAGRTPPAFLDPGRIASRHAARRAWAWGCCAGVLLLALQLVYVYRTPVAVAVPALRPVLTMLCQPLGCEVGHARRIERISIVSSSLRAPPGAAQQDAGRQRLVLTVVLRNRYEQDQPWPALVLDLTDLSDTVVARKVLRPEAYLTPAQLAGPMAAQAEVTLRVPIEVAGLQVNGYQLDKFFP